MELTPEQLAWLRQRAWAVTSAADCWGVDEEDRGAPQGYALYDASDDDPPVAVFDWADDALMVCDIFRSLVAQAGPWVPEPAPPYDGPLLS